MSFVELDQDCDLRLGTQLVGHLIHDGKTVWNRYESYVNLLSGNRYYTIPEWATYVVVLFFGGGGGGRHGDGGNGSAGRGGGSGEGRIVGRGLPSGADRQLAMNVGDRGTRGTGNSSPPTAGQSTIIMINGESLTSEGGAAGGTTGSPTGQNGAKSGWYPIGDEWCRRLDIPLGSTVEAGPNGTGNGGTGYKGAGGAGGNGGLFGSYSNGGHGGPGFVEVHSWGGHL